MQNLRVESWQQWEKLCCYFMEQMASHNLGENVRYQSYGSQGQNQHGIDLVPISSSLPFVGQCKLRENSFRWEDALSEVAKTDGYSNPIRHYVIFTTAPIHTSVQDVRNRGVYVHTRPNGTQFQVYVKYWGEITDLSFIPQNVLQEIFPGAYQLAASAAPVGPRPGLPAQSDYLASLRALKQNVPTWIGPADLHWLETWDFGQGYVREQDFEPFDTLYIECTRVEAACAGIPEWFHEQNRASIAECLPAGNNFFRALGAFRDAIVDQSVGQGEVGCGILTLSGLPQSSIISAVARWKSAAGELAATYKRDILGQAMRY